MSLSEALTLPAAYRLEELGQVTCLRASAADLANAGAEEGTIIVATVMTEARGYQNKFWQGFAGNMHASLVLEPECHADRYHEMLILGVTSLGSSLATHVAPMTSLSYRWPNDLYIAGQKVASVWLDKGSSSKGDWLTVTVSANLLHAPGDDTGDFTLPTMSVREAEGNSDTTVELMLETWSRQFIAEINNWHERGFEHILAYWKARSERKELEEVTLLDGSKISGSQQHIYDDGACSLIQESGDSIDLSLPQYLHWV